MIQKIKNIISSGDYEIKFVSKFRGFKNVPIKGFIDPETDTILINQNLSHNEKITTIIHEFIHELEPSWSETKVEKACQQISKKLNKSDKSFFNNLV